jgi:hypothetical protein
LIDILVNKMQFTKAFPGERGVPGGMSRIATIPAVDIAMAAAGDAGAQANATTNQVVQSGTGAPTGSPVVNAIYVDTATGTQYLGKAGGGWAAIP